MKTNSLNSESKEEPSHVTAIITSLIAAELGSLLPPRCTLIAVILWGLWELLRKVYQARYEAGYEAGYEDGVQQGQRRDRYRHPPSSEFGDVDCDGDFTGVENHTHHHYHGERPPEHRTNHKPVTENADSKEVH